MTEPHGVPTPRGSGADLPMLVPTQRTLWMRTSPLVQLLRFVAINLKMLRMIRLSHAHPVPPRKR